MVLLLSMRVKSLRPNIVDRPPLEACFTKHD